MKPINLKIAGLHSFREEQEIDFESLCASGLFGIFGPTGSGKSTVLDAITLALYGKVERASHGTQGIINQSEDRLSIAFTFALHQAAGTKRYRVERLYKRTGESTVNCAKARLVELADGVETPLADKAGQVNERVEALLGLSVDDFTRAVVLPQGKFDEFLKKIKPVERRGMLERLFGLTAYGEKLRKKVDARLREVDRKLEGIEGELKGLGDASDEALEQARRHAQTAKEEADKASKALQIAEQDYKTKEQLWQWQNELADVTQQMTVLREKETEIHLAEQRLDEAQRAARVIPLVRAVEEAEKDVGGAETRLDVVKGERDKAAGLALEAQDALRKARQARVDEEPLLHQRKERLRQALEIERDLVRIRRDAAARTDGLKAKAAGKSRAETALTDKRAAREQAQLLLQDCRHQLAQTVVAPERRKRAEAALAALRDWRRAQQDYEKETAAQAAKDKQLASAELTLKQATADEHDAAVRLAEVSEREQALRQARPATDGVTLQALARTLAQLQVQVAGVLELRGGMEKTMSAVRESEDVVARGRSRAKTAEDAVLKAGVALDNAVRRVQELERRLEDLRGRDVASRLARLLKTGEPCPVCGSREHPQPTLSPASDEEQALQQELDEAQAALEANQASLREAENEKAAAGAAIDAAVQICNDAQGRLREYQERMASALGRMPRDWAALTPTGMQDRLEAEMASQDAGQQAWNCWQDETARIQAELETVRSRHSEAAQKLVIAQEAVRAAQAAAREAGTRAEASLTALQDCRARLDQARQDLEVEAIERERQLIDTLDHRRAELEKQGTSLERGLSALDKDIEALTAQVSGLAVEVSTHGQELKSIQSQLAEKEALLQELTGGHPAAVILNSVEDRLRGLADREKQAAVEAEAAASRRETAEKELAAADSMLRNTRQRLDSESARLDQALREMRFVTRNQAVQAVLDAGEQDALEKNIKAFREEGIRLATLEQSLTEKLAGRALSPEEWLACQEALDAARQARDGAVQDSGAAAQEYQRLAAINARWKETKQAAERIGRDHKRLETLKDLLRGNAFVEYLAEEQLAHVARDASARLGQLTRHRYALEVDSEGGFVIRDEANGGVKRPVSSLSGGETFVASLALALALSAQIQLKGSYPLEFFFLDEGFGTLDPDLLEVVVSTLEQLRMEHVNIGVISHVSELRQRLPRRLVVHPAKASGVGSRLEMEMA